MPSKLKSLKNYRAKRNFAKTSEPSGSAEIAPAKYPRFVIQKHAATRLHYDLRLEHAGVFKSWAITKSPSLDPRNKRLAVEVEDHPLDYGDFEGTIAKSEYGGGTVMVWDRGFWMPEGSPDIDEALRNGELKFSLAGSKLKGSWVLVRMKHNRAEKQNNWLLIKHRDAFADDDTDITERDLSIASQRTMADIAVGKGRRPAPFMVATAAAEPPSERPLFVAPQLCKTTSRPPKGESWVHEIKFDGYRMQMRVDAGIAVMRTRNGLDWTAKFPSIAKAAAGLSDAIVDGEVVALDASGAPDFAALQAALSASSSHDLVYFAFDLLFDGDTDLRAVPLAKRKQRLKAVITKLKPTKLIRYVDHLRGSGEAVFDSACSMNLEGIISKRIEAPYRSGRTDTWVKSKCRAGHQVVIGGWSGTDATLRSLVAGVYRGGELAYVGQVGTGFNARNTPALLSKLIAAATNTKPFKGKNAPRRQADWKWVKPFLVAEIEFAGWTASGMVRQSAFKRLRADTLATEVVRLEPASTDSDAAPLVALSSAGPTTGLADNVIMGVTLSHPDKALWPADATTQAVSKRELASYLEQVGPWMIDHLRGRPCSIVRAPDGITGQTFFQRHAMPGMKDFVALAHVEGDRKPYLQIDRIEGLIALAQFSAIEFHPWNCAPGDPDVPGRLVFDLDPDPDLPFAAVMSAAKELKARLEKLGLVTFCKTTGGKGLHVVVPLRVEAGRPLGWPEAKGFAQAVCSEMATDAPDRYLVNMSKKKRQGRIFLDYLRNDRMSTAFAPLSPRARPGAPVSMPVSWGQIRAGLDPMRFTVKTVPAILRRSRPWQDYSDAGRPLAAAIKLLLNTRRTR